MADLSNSIARIQVYYNSLTPAERLRVHSWCERVIERAGQLPQLERMSQSYPPSRQWQCLRFLLPNEAIPVLEKHLESLAGEQLDLFSMSGGHGRQEKS